MRLFLVAVWKEILKKAEEKNDNIVVTYFMCWNWCGSKPLQTKVVDKTIDL